MATEKLQPESGKNHTPASSEKPSIAVLPFLNLSPDPEQGYFVDGLTEEILNSIAQLKDVTVIARTSAFSFKGTDKTAQQIADILGVTHILEGSVRKEGNSLRITAQLIDGIDGSHLWSKRYDRELDVKQIFAVQEDIAANVANELKLTLGIGESLKKSGGTDNLEAYDAYLMGKQLHKKTTTKNIAKSIEYFQKAIDLDNNFAPAYVALARGCLAYCDFCGLPGDEWYQKAETAIGRALDIDDQQCEAYAELGLLHWHRCSNEKAEAAYKRALELNSNNRRAHIQYVMLLEYEARFIEALIHVQKSVELDPLSLGGKNIMASVLEGMGRFDEALQLLSKNIEIDPQFWPAFFRKGYIYYHLGQFCESAKMLRKASSIDPDSPWDKTFLGFVCLDSGDTERAAYWFEQAIKKSPKFSVSMLGMLFLNAYLGKEKSAKKYGRDILKFTSGMMMYEEDRIYVRGYFGDLDLKAGHYNVAGKWFTDAYPELLDPETVNIGFMNYPGAISLAHVLIKTGERKHANMLLNKCMAYIKTLTRLGEYGYGIADVRIYMLQGKKKDALNSLREAVDSGWRRSWRYYLEVESILEPLHDDPEFKAIVQEIKDDMAAQLVQVRELEKDEMEASEELKILDKAKERVISHLSHELRTPLATISGILKLMSEKMPDKTMERAIARGQRNVNRLLDLQYKVDDILKQRIVKGKDKFNSIIESVTDLEEAFKEEGHGDYKNLLESFSQRIEALFKSEGIRMEQIRIDEFLDELCTQTETAMAGRDLTIDRQFQKDITITMDMGILRKSAFGVLKNAIENTPDEGRIVVSATLKNNEVHIEVKDHGVGITKENQRLIFGGFFHTQGTELYSSGTPYAFNAGGTGADLLRIKGFSDQFDFSVDFESTRCRFIPTDNHRCAGKISACEFIGDRSECLSSGGSRFSLIFPY